MLAIKSRNFNIDALLKLVIVLGFALFFFITIQTGKVLLFVHPRMVPYMNFGIVAMLVMSLFILGDILKPQRKKVNIIPYLFFIIPLIMAFSFPANNISTSSMSMGNMNVASPDRSTLQDNASITDNSDNIDTNNKLTVDGSSSDNSTDANSVFDDTSSENNLQNTDMSPMDDDETEDNSLKLQGDTVVMDDNNFVNWVQEIYNNPSKYEGKKIEVTGFVFKDKQFKSNEFVPARLMMVCCAADMSPIGLLAQYNNASELRQDSWFNFSGKIVIGEFKGQQTAVIDIESAERTVKPKNEYVYPY
jgi:putative membrane protein